MRFINAFFQLRLIVKDELFAILGTRKIMESLFPKKEFLKTGN
jgi:hypothetical protein